MEDGEPWWDGVARIGVAPAHDGAIRMSKMWEESPIMERLIEGGGYHSVTVRTVPCPATEAVVLDTVRAI